MSPASSDQEIDLRVAAGPPAHRRSRRRLALRWRIEAAAYALVLLAFGAVPIVLAMLADDPFGLVARLPIAVLEALALALGVVMVELFRALRGRAQGDDGDGGSSLFPFSHDSGGAQSESAGDSIHEHRSNSPTSASTLDTVRRSSRDAVSRSGPRE